MQFHSNGIQGPERGEGVVNVHARIVTTLCELAWVLECKLKILPVSF